MPLKLRSPILRIAMFSFYSAFLIGSSFLLSFSISFSACFLSATVSFCQMKQGPFLSYEKQPQNMNSEKSVCFSMKKSVFEYKMRSKTEEALIVN